MTRDGTEQIDADDVVDLPIRDYTALAEALADFLLACLDASPRASETVDTDAAAE